MLTTVVFAIFGYLMGSVSTAIVVCRIMGLPDPRQQGSGNPGATNVLRIGGKKAAIITLLGDGLKGFIPVLIANLAGIGAVGVALTALGAFLGHLYPLFFGFRGGKGVATAFGAILGLSQWVGLAVLAIWLIVAFVFRMSSLSALIAAVLTPVLFWFFAAPGVYIQVALVMLGFLLWRHRSNIPRLLSGTEGKIKLGAKN
jgi:glycerol-3-phosphate acyltransferase PlsY